MNQQLAMTEQRLNLHLTSTKEELALFWRDFLFKIKLKHVHIFLEDLPSESSFLYTLLQHPASANLIEGLGAERANGHF